MQVVVPDEYKFLYERSERRPVVKVPDPVLREKCKPVTRISNRVRLIAEEMVRAMRLAHGIGLAAPQMGFTDRIIVIAPDSRPIVLFNPEITESSGSVVNEEGCLSLPGLYGDVRRASKVTVKGLDRKGREVVYDMEGLAARVVQHEIDHLDGILFIDKADPSTLHWQLPAHEEASAV